MAFWSRKRVVVTGGAGFIGKHVVDTLCRGGALVTVPILPGQPNDRVLAFTEGVRVLPADLTCLENCLHLCRGQEAVVNLAALDGSVEFKRRHGARIFRNNTLITLSMLEAARLSGVERFLVMSSAEVYGADAPVPTPETAATMSQPSGATALYAWSKRVGEVAGQAYAQDYGLKIAIARPTNVYGPGDHFGEGGRVIPDLIERVLAGENPIKVWSSGEQTRSFLYVDDVAEALLALLERYPEADPVNLGSSREIAIKDLAELVIRISDRDATVEVDTSKPAGSPRRVLDLTKAQEILGFNETIALEEGIERTLHDHRQVVSARSGVRTWV